jgi:phage head maturation protease
LEVELWEVSLVTFPMLPEARVAPEAVEAKGVEDLRDLARAFEDARAKLAARNPR